MASDNSDLELIVAESDARKVNRKSEAFKSAIIDKLYERENKGVKIQSSLHLSF